MKIGINVKERYGINRINEHITIGVPVVKGEVFDVNELCVFDKEEIDSQIEVLSRWGDNSIKWVLLDFKASVKANKSKKYFLSKGKIKDKKKYPFPGSVDFLKKLNFIAEDGRGIKYKAVLGKPIVETIGGLRFGVRYKGKFKSGKKSLFDYNAIFDFLSEGVIKLDITIRNPRAAKHKNGFWDLGDKGSIFFKSLNLIVENKGHISYKSESGKKFKECNNFVIHQDSSGLKNWESRNHVNKNNEVRFSFKGYQIKSDKGFEEGLKAQPVVKSGNISFSLKHFWENFPKSIKGDSSKIVLGLFPNCNYIHELQGGEQKTHTMYFDLNGRDMNFVDKPLDVFVDPKYLCIVIPYLSVKKDKRYQKLIDNFISDFFGKNEKIDEYGWRNFGDIYADHEGDLISHYNNQYDVINGCMLQYFTSGNNKWKIISENMAKHVRDIDIYHTKKDESVYNNGLFWHTFHYTDAYTSTHRCYSKLGVSKMREFNYGVGGGPSSEHNYATGLMHSYFLTGDSSFKEAVIGLADWVINMDDGAKSKVKLFGFGASGKASQSESVYYHGPGRGSGNSVNVLLDGFEVSCRRKYLVKAEELVKRCIHPKDNFSELSDIEHRWFYLVFLQALGRYLDVKVELGELDYIFYYAKESLLHYAEWIFNKEVPYYDVLDKVDIPSESWPAQDIRKTCVLDYAYKYSGEKRFKDKAEFFFDRCIEDVNKFDSKGKVRPLAILMHYSLMHSYFRENDFVVKVKDIKFNFGKPKKFKQRGYWLFRLRDMIKS